MYYKEKYPRPNPLPKRLDILVKRHNDRPYFELLFLEGSERKLTDENFYELLEKLPIDIEQEEFRNMIEYVCSTGCFLLTATQPQKFYLSEVKKLLGYCEEHGVQPNFTTPEGQKVRRDVILNELTLIEQKKAEKRVLEDLMFTMNIKITTRKTENKTGMLYA